MDRLILWFNRFKYLLIIFLIILIMIICIAIYKLDEVRNKNFEIDILDIEDDTEDEIEIVEEVIESVFVDIKGEVINPGVYEMDINSKVINVIDKAGGITEYADTSLINLSKNVFNEMVIIIYNKDEVLKKKNETNKEVEQVACVCPIVLNDGCLEPIESSNNLISINTATVLDLVSIPGIGETKALDIINYRDSIGQFSDINEIKNVSGIGDSTFDKIKNYITL